MGEKNDNVEDATIAAAAAAAVVDVWVAKIKIDQRTSTMIASKRGCWNLEWMTMMARGGPSPWH